MISILLTLFSSLSLTGLAAWFSVTGIMVIYAATPWHSLIMGITLEVAKLVTTSWLYRNWEFANWKIKFPLIVFTIIIMIITSVGVFGFLTKSHLGQISKTIDNLPKIEMIDQHIQTEKILIADNEKIISQLDLTVNSYINKDRLDKSVLIRKNQIQQRTQLRNEIDLANKRINVLNDEKFKLQSEIRSVEIEVGPIRNIADLIYSSKNSSENIESSLRIFTFLIVLVLDPLAVILLIAANHSILRYQNEKKKIPSKINETSGPSVDSHDFGNPAEEATLYTTVANNKTGFGAELANEENKIHEEKLDFAMEEIQKSVTLDLPVIKSPIFSRVFNDIPGDMPKKVEIDEINKHTKTTMSHQELLNEIINNQHIQKEDKKQLGPRIVGWLTEFKGMQNE